MTESESIHRLRNFVAYASHCFELKDQYARWSLIDQAALRMLLKCYTDKYYNNVVSLPEPPKPEGGTS